MRAHSRSVSRALCWFISKSRRSSRASQSLSFDGVWLSECFRLLTGVVLPLLAVEVLVLLVKVRKSRGSDLRLGTLGGGPKNFGGVEWLNGVGDCERAVCERAVLSSSDPVFRGSACRPLPRLETKEDDGDGDFPFFVDEPGKMTSPLAAGCPADDACGPTGLFLTPFLFAGLTGTKKLLRNPGDLERAGERDDRYGDTLLCVRLHHSLMDLSFTGEGLWCPGERDAARDRTGLRAVSRRLEAQLSVCKLLCSTASLCFLCWVLSAL